MYGTAFQTSCGFQNHTPSSVGWSIVGTAKHVDVLYVQTDSWSLVLFLFRLLTFSSSVVLMLLLIFRLGKPFVLAFFAFHIRFTATYLDEQTCI